jgi:hypothetical protein
MYISIHHGAAISRGKLKNFARPGGNVQKKGGRLNGWSASWPPSSPWGRCWTTWPVPGGWPIHRVLATVSVLEARRLVRKVGGNRVARV